MATYYVLLGPPGAGKGTQAQIIAKRFGIAHVSSGDIFRENLTANTELGVLAKSYMERGELVPDEVTIAMIRNRVDKDDCANGVLFDGFPRTLTQAKALDEMLASIGSAVKAVPYIAVPSAVLMQRLGGRVSCRANGHVYNLANNPPKVEGKCDLDGSELYQRDDDKPDTVRRRIEVYLEQTAPLLRYYRDLGLLIEIDGTQPIEKVSSALTEALEHA